MAFQHSTSDLQRRTSNDYRGIFNVGLGVKRYSKKVPPPTPDRREGRLFPPEQLWKTLRLVNELAAGRNKNLCEKIHMNEARRDTNEMNDEARMSNNELMTNDQRGSRKRGRPFFFNIRSSKLA